MLIDSYFNRFVLPEDLTDAVTNCQWRCYPETKEQLEELCFGPTHSSRFDVTYTIPGKGVFKEAEVVRCKNGPVVNFMEDYMRRRDPDCMRIGDDLPTDKPRFKDVYGYDFADLRKETIERNFGTAKEFHGMRYTQMKGKEKMGMKVALTFTCMNIKKLAKLLFPNAPMPSKKLKSRGYAFG